MSAAELAPGFIGDRYRLERMIARGGMAEVWLGHDTFLDRQVAIKVLKRHIARDETAIERFRREALQLEHATGVSRDRPLRTPSA